MNKHFRLCVAVFGGMFLSFAAVQAAQACDPATQPCSVIFTLDEQNNMVLQNVEDGYRTEGVLRLTVQQAQLAANGPQSHHNILKPHAEVGGDEFAETVKRLAAIPGLSFLNDPAKASEAAQSAHGDAGQAMALSGAAAGKNPVCAQMHLVLKATLEEATSEAFNTETDYITAPEIVQACGHAAAAKMIQWYEAEQRKLAHS